MVHTLTVPKEKTFSDSRQRGVGTTATRTCSMLQAPGRIASPCGDVPDAKVGPHPISLGKEDPAYLPLVKQSAEHGSYPRSPDQAVVFHRRPDKGSPKEMG